ncbi:uncharacterized protein [Dermacentor albipictus]|uniref:uncharacterized protein n=1 Tax=Dermacentor albipictus TaxID=60249 RepID=UPI0038FC098D
MSHVPLHGSVRCKLLKLRQRRLLEELENEQQDRARNPRENLTEGTLQSATMEQATEQQGTEEPPIERLQALKLQPQPEISSRCREERQRRRLMLKARVIERYGLGGSRAEAHRDNVRNFCLRLEHGGSRAEAHRDNVRNFCLRLEQRLMALNKEAAQQTMNEVENMMSKERQDLRRHI